MDLIFNLFDIAVFGVIVASAIISIFRGFIKELFSILAWIFAYILTVWIQPVLSNALSESVFIEHLSYIILFIALLFVGKLLANMIDKLIKLSGLSVFNRFLGIIFGLIRGVLLVSILSIFLPKDFGSSALGQDSRIYPVIIQYNPFIMNISKTMIQINN